MKAMSAEKIAEIISGTYVGPAGIVVEGNCQFDSRVISKGDLFIALQGEAHDGHDFAADAFSRGARIAIVTRPVDGPHIIVANVIESIGALARHIRTELKDLVVVAITGSQGKTTTKDILATILSQVGPTIAPQGSYNNDLGVPVTLLRCDEGTRFCIVEMGARHIGDIARLVEIAQPNVGAVLRVGTAHLGEFGSREMIAAAKSEIVRGLHAGATAVLGTYDEFTPQMASGLALRTITFGESSHCDVRAADIEIRGGYPHFDLVTPDGREPVELHLLGAHQISNALAAAAIAHALGIATGQIATALSMHEPTSKWRMELHEGNGELLINDAYNANPESMEAALRTLVLLTQERGGRSWAFLGTMHELGANSAKLHREVGQLAAKLGVDHIVAIANRELITIEDPGESTLHFFEKPRDVERLFEQFDEGDVILVKASRAEHLEEVADSIIRRWNADDQNEKESTQ